MIKVEHQKKILDKLSDYPVFHLFIKYAISEDKYDLYVDQKEDPKTIIMHVPPAFVLYGEVPMNHTDDVKNLMKKGSWIISPNVLWDTYLTQIYENNIQSHPRIQFDEQFLDIVHLNSLRKPLPEGLRLVNIDESNVNQWMIEGQITSRFFVNRPFLKHGFGLCLLDEKNEVQGFALTNYPVEEGNEIEVSYRIGYDDFEVYRKRGIGTTLVSMFLEMAIKKGYRPIWDAATDISAHIAKKLGYIEKKKWMMHHIIGE